MSQDSHRRKKVQICSTSPGYPVYCPKCDSTNVLIFYDPRFTPRLQTKWDELIDQKRILLENMWEKIKDENNWGKLQKGSEKPNWICKDCYDGGVILERKNKNQEQVDRKILNVFQRFEKTFTEKSAPLYLDECGEKVTMQEIHDKAGIGDNSLALIAATRKQYNTDNFSKYREYIKNTLKKSTIYYALWPNTEENNVEYDVLYTTDTADHDEIQRHLNLHDEINNGVTQKMALIIDKNGNWEIIHNEKL